MYVKLSSKNQVTIPMSLAQLFGLRKGDILEVERQGNKIVMVQKEVVLEDKYPKEDLEKAEKYLSKSSKDEKHFESSGEMVNFLKKRVKK